ncbi:MAG: AMP-binding protein [Pseudomonadota bacterium]
MKLRKIATWTPKLGMRRDPDGVIRIWREDPLGPYSQRVTEPLMGWAARDPGRIWIAERGADDRWHRLSYGEAAERIARIGQALLDHALSVERPLLILSGNSIDHALMALGAQHVGIPSAAIAPAYSLASRDTAKLRMVAEQLTPGMIFAEDGAAYGAAISAVFGSDLPVISSVNPLPDRGLSIAALTETPASKDVAAAHAAVGADTVAKFLFTSGTTGTPKAVVQTHGGLCANQAMISDCYAFLRDAAPVICDWAPWNHVAAGSKTFYMVQFHGGTHYIDGGKPAPGAIDTSIRNLRLRRAGTSMSRPATIFWSRQWRRTRRCATISSRGSTI